MGVRRQCEACTTCAHCPAAFRPAHCTFREPLSTMALFSFSFTSAWVFPFFSSSAHTIPEFRSNRYLSNPTIIACCSTFHLPADHCAFPTTVLFTSFCIGVLNLPYLIRNCLYRPSIGFNKAQNTPRQAYVFPAEDSFSFHCFQGDSSIYC